MLSEQEFSAILALGHEQRGVEFKGPGSLADRQLRAKVVRGILGMANRRDGGYVIVGAEDNHSAITPVGLAPHDLRTWRNDDLADAVASYADPYVTFETAVIEVTTLSYLVIQVQEFEEIPVLCKRDYQNVLRAGACYVRTRRKPETSEIPSQTEMRELIELATEKRLRRFVEQAQAAGLGSSQSERASADELFGEQLRNSRI